MDTTTINNVVGPIYDLASFATPLLVLWMSWDKVKGFTKRLSPF